MHRLTEWSRPTNCWTQQIGTPSAAGSRQAMRNGRSGRLPPWPARSPSRTTTAFAGVRSTSSSSCSSATTGRSCTSSWRPVGSSTSVPPRPGSTATVGRTGTSCHDRVPRLGGDRGSLRGGDRGTPLPGSGALHGRGAPTLRTPRGALGCAARGPSASGGLTPGERCLGGRCRYPT